MLFASFTIRFVQGAPLLLRGRSRSVELLSCSRCLPRSMSSSGATFENDMMHIQNYPELKIQPLTVSDYHRMIRGGLLDKYRVELLNGVLVKKFSHSVEHCFTLSFLYEKIFDALKDRAAIRQAFPITLVKSKSEPEPDIVIASGTKDDYCVRHPSPSDILLVIEVSKSALANDRTIKLENYASEGIPEYWIVNIQKRNVEVHRKPRGNSYESKETFSSSFIRPCCLLGRPHKSERFISFLSKPKVIQAGRSVVQQQIPIN